MQSLPRYLVFLGLVVLCVFSPEGSGLARPQTQNCALEAPEWAPRGSATTTRPRVSVTLTSTCGAAIEVSSIKMTIDDETVMPKVDGSGSKVTVSYTPESALEQEADHTVVVQARDAAGTPGEKRWTFHIGDTYSR
jgi:hypothetical protein